VNDIQDWQGQTTIIKGDFDKDGKDEIFLYNTRLRKGKFIVFPNQTAKECLSLSSANNPLQIINYDSGKPTAKENDKVIGGDFNNEGKYAVTVFYPGTNNCSVIGLDNTRQIITRDLMNCRQLTILKDVSDFSVNTCRMSTHAPSVLVLSYLQNGLRAYKSLVLNKERSDWVETTLTFENSFLSANTTILTGNFTEKKILSMVLLDRTWKFDCKLAMASGNTVSVKNTIDFTGFTPGLNPKFYQHLELVSGNFIENGKTALVAVMCNCADLIYSEKFCKTISKDGAFPPSIQLYSF
jgi:hypothetical protein